MTTQRLGKLYDRLTVWERIPLLVAADARNDDTEYRRLFDTSPIRAWQFPEHLLAEQALNILALTYISAQLDSVGVYFHALFQLERKDAPKEIEDFVLISETNAYVFVVQADAWRRFCADVGVSPQALVAGNHSGWLLSYCEEEMSRHAPTKEELQALWTRHGQETPALITSELLYESFHRILKAMTRHAPADFGKEEA